MHFFFFQITFYQYMLVVYTVCILCVNLVHVYNISLFLFFIPFSPIPSSSLQLLMPLPFEKDVSLFSFIDYLNINHLNHVILVYMLNLFHLISHSPDASIFRQMTQFYLSLCQNCTPLPCKYNIFFIYQLTDRHIGHLAVSNYGTIKISVHVSL